MVAGLTPFVLHLFVDVQAPDGRALLTGKSIYQAKLLFKHK
jgi:hypothetical protein